MKNQHHLSQFYQRLWSKDDNVIVYPVDGTSCFKTNIRNIGADKHFYTHPSIDKNLDHLGMDKILRWLENVHSRQWETQFLHASQDDIRREAAFAVAAMYLRSPKHKELIERNIADTRAAIANLMPHELITVEEGYASVTLTAAEASHRYRDDPEMLQSAFLAHLGGQVESLTEAIFGKKWLLAAFPAGGVVTCDAPVVFEATGKGKTAERTDDQFNLYFPISPRLVLYASDDLDDDFSIKQFHETARFNSPIIINSTRFVIAQAQDPKIEALIKRLRCVTGPLES